VHAEDFIIDDRGQTQVVENLCAVSPHIHVTVLSQALIIEAIDLCDLPAFVVASDEGDTVRIAHLRAQPLIMFVGRHSHSPHLESQKQKKSFHAVISSVYEVSEEQVIRPGTLSSHFEQLDEVVELAVDIAANLQKEDR
jgi:hypothetical protein